MACLFKRERCCGAQLITFHTPVIDCGLGDESDSVDVNPLPKDDVFRHRVGLHFRFHLDVEDLEGFASLESDDFRLGVHDR